MASWIGLIGLGARLAGYLRKVILERRQLAVEACQFLEDEDSACPPFRDFNRSIKIGLQIGTRPGGTVRPPSISPWDPLKPSFKTMMMAPVDRPPRWFHYRIDVTNVGRRRSTVTHCGLITETPGGRLLEYEEELPMRELRTFGESEKVRVSLDDTWPNCQLKSIYVRDSSGRPWRVSKTNVDEINTERPSLLKSPLQELSLQESDD